MGSEKSEASGHIEVEITAGAIRFLQYPFRSATVHPAGTVEAADIRDADPDAGPLEIRRHDGETLFLPRARQVELAQFCVRNGVAVRRRPDVWGCLLEPFLDTEVDDAQSRTVLHDAGFDDREIDDIRRTVAPCMIAYNFTSGLWDWVSLGLADLLNARSGILSGPEFRLSDQEFAAAYRWAMDIADRGATP